MTQPVLTILAGSNGSGKSTLTSSARDEFQMAPVLDPDAIARSIRDSMPGGESNLEAGKRVLLRAQELIQARESFTVETTLSGSTYLRLAAQAKAAGFRRCHLRRNEVSGNQLGSSEGESFKGRT